VNEPDATRHPVTIPLAAAFDRRLVLDVHALRAVEFELLGLDAALDDVASDDQRTAIESRLAAIRWVVGLGEVEP